MSKTSYSLPLEPVTAPLRLHKRKVPWALLGVLLIAFAAVPGLGNDYWLNAIFIPFLVLSLAGLGLNLLTGYTGQTSVGAAGFMAVGAFATYGLLLRVPELGLPLSLLGAGVISALVGWLFGLPSSRIKGFYLMVTTLAAQFFLEWLFVKFPWFYNNGASGTISAPHLTLLGHDLNNPVDRYLLTLVTVVILTWVAVNLVKSQVGRNWMAIRDMDTAAAVVGIAVVRYKHLAFAISSFYLGIAGALWAFAYLGTASAGSFDINRSFQILFIIIIGGMGSIAGNFVGAAFICLLPIFLDHAGQALFGGAVDAGQLQNLQKIIFGVLIIVFLIKEPEGLIRLLKNAQERLVRWPLRF
ncbi:MAG: branched-chain amino acid ABC transporter permease [Janthinobacterium lividum]|jgi:branched-chain amino acid transport system permease protein